MLSIYYICSSFPTNNCGSGWQSKWNRFLMCVIARCIIKTPFFILHPMGKSNEKRKIIKLFLHSIYSVNQMTVAFYRFHSLTNNRPCSLIILYYYIDSSLFPKPKTQWTMANYCINCLSRPNNGSKIGFRFKSFETIQWWWFVRNFGKLQSWLHSAFSLSKAKTNTYELLLNNKIIDSTDGFVSHIFSIKPIISFIKWPGHCLFRAFVFDFYSSNSVTGDQ